MSNIKIAVEGFLYPLIEKYSECVYLDGEETVIHNVNVLDEKSAFTHGALIHATTILFIHYTKSNDLRGEAVLKRIHKFIDLISDREAVGTWGKLGILRALNKLKKNGLLHCIDQDRLSILDRLTDYSDFYDREKAELKGYATNYYQVALACALYREALGFECVNESLAIEKKFFDIAFPNGVSFMDDEAGKGRFDRYSLIMSSEISDLYRDLSRPIPDVVLKNLRLSAEYSLFMANSAGDGVNYGRSLSVHGDITPIEILTSAISRDLLNEDEKKLALSYIFATLQKCFYFWYNDAKGSFDLWWDGRTTNMYRQIHRLLEVNMDMACHIYTLYDNVVSAGLERVAISSLFPTYSNWKFEKIDYSDVHKAYILRYSDYLAILPFIGTKAYALTSSYNPFPSICGIVEGSPESKLPFLVPEYTDKNGDKFRPVHYVYKTEEKYTQEGLSIVAYGKMMKLDADFSESSREYRQYIDLSGNEILVEFEVDGEYSSAEMFTATQNETARILVGGFSKSKRLFIENNDDFKTPHGAYSDAYMHFSDQTERLGYKIIIND